MMLCITPRGWSRLVLLCYVLTAARATVNLFLDEVEVRRILGLKNSSIYYLQEGVVNEYALSFTIPVPVKIARLRFHWQSTSRRKAPYKLKFEYNNPGALYPPEIDIPYEGLVPFQLRNFTIFLLCNGIINAEVDVIININITFPAPLLEFANLSIRRKKICIKGCSYKRSELKVTCQDELFASSETSSHSVSIEVESFKNAYIIAGCLCVFLLTCLSITIIMYVYKKRNEKKSSVYSSISSDNYEGLFSYKPNCNVDAMSSCKKYGYTIANSDVLVGSSDRRVACTPENPKNSARQDGYATVTFLHNGSANYDVQSDLGKYQFNRQGHEPSSNRFNDRMRCENLNSDEETELHTYDMSFHSSTSVSNSVSMANFWDAENCKDLSYSCNSLIFKRTLLKGSFSKVNQGIFLGDTKIPMQKVLIKSLSDDAPSNQKALFLSQGLMTYGLNYKHILSMIGMCTLKCRSSCIFYPYVEKGNLKRFLIQERERIGFGHCSLDFQDIVNIAHQISLALLFLHDNLIIHHDVATRNCYIDSVALVKLSDSAVSKDLFPDDYCCIYGDENRPIKWLAPECMRTDVFSMSSDVWSFGIVIWELLTFAQQPYDEINPLNMLDYLEDGFRLAQPLNCPDKLFMMICACWQLHPVDRPSIIKINQILNNMRSEPKRL